MDLHQRPRGFFRTMASRLHTLRPRPYPRRGSDQTGYNLSSGYLVGSRMAAGREGLGDGPLLLT